MRAVEITVAGWARDPVRYHPDVASKFLPSTRPVAVALPPGYDLEPDRRFPVLYLHDGQNLFDATTAFAGVPWGCDETAVRLARSGSAAPVILVGVGNTPERLREYGPRGDDDATADLSREYGHFLVDELKPLIDRIYRTLTGPEFTGVGGSSMGGLVSLHLCQWYPRAFGRCAALSPSLWWDRESFLRTIEFEADWLRSCRIWLDMGGREGASQTGMKANLRRAAKLAARFTRLGLLAGRDFCYFEDPDGTHDETAWGRRFADGLRFLFPSAG
jgi:predicted alpha/beta superfamily hydrolase